MKHNWFRIEETWKPEEESATELYMHELTGTVALFAYSKKSPKISVHIHNKEFLHDFEIICNSPVMVDKREYIQDYLTLGHSRRKFK